MFSNSLNFFVLLKKCSLQVQTSVFQIRTQISTLNYVADDFSAMAQYHYLNLYEYFLSNLTLCSF